MYCKSPFWKGTFYVSRAKIRQLKITTHTYTYVYLYLAHLYNTLEKCSQNIICSKNYVAFHEIADIFRSKILKRSL